MEREVDSMAELVWKLHQEVVKTKNKRIEELERQDYAPNGVVDESSDQEEYQEVETDADTMNDVDYGNRTGMIFTCIQESEGYVTMRDVADSLFGEGDDLVDPERDSSLYSKYYNAFQDLLEEGKLEKEQDGDYMVYSLKGQDGESDTTGSPPHVDDAIDELGKRNWDILLNALLCGDSCLFPEQGDKDIGYYDFSGQFPGTEDYSTREMWQTLFASDHVMDAVNQVTDGVYEFTWNKTGRDASSPEMWYLNVKYVGGNS